jgi:hypothetical protein
MVGDSQKYLNNASDDSSGSARYNDELLALEIRPKRLAFAALQGPTMLLDWGVRRCASKSGDRHVNAIRTLQRLMDLYTPRILVIRQKSAGSTHSRRDIAVIARKLRLAAAKRSVETHFVDQGTIQRFFAEYDAKTKHQIATRLSIWFEELSWKLPPKRRLWQGEPHNMIIFDAVGTAMAFLASESEI